MQKVLIRGEPWESEYIKEMVVRIQNEHFVKQCWKRRDALILKDGTRATPFDGQEYDPNVFVLVRGFWDHDHCAICNWRLYECEDREHNIGYFNGTDWVCTECYNLFFAEKSGDSNVQVPKRI